MFKNLILSSILIFTFTGCFLTTNKLEYPSTYYDTSRTKENKVVYFPHLNKTSTVEVGENMFSKSKLVYPTTYIVKLLEGTSTGYNNIDNTYTKLSTSLLQKWKYQNKKVNVLCLANEICLSDLNNNGYFTNYGSRYGYLSYRKLKTPVKYEITPSKPYMDENSFKYIVLYQGKNENKIKLSFREFKNNLARPAFTQNIEYTLNKNKPTIVGFKGLRMQIINASNVNITYKVLKDFK